MLCYDKGFNFFKVTVHAYRIHTQNCTVLGGGVKSAQTVASLI